MRRVIAKPLSFPAAAAAAAVELGTNNDDTLNASITPIRKIRYGVPAIYLAEAEPEQPTAGAEGRDDERQTEQEANVGRRQTGDVDRVD